MNKSKKLQQEIAKNLKIFTQRKKCIEKYRATLEKQREKEKNRKTVKATKEPKVKEPKAKEPKVKEPKVKEPKAKKPKTKKMSDSLEKI
jgi:hypothetical protein